MKKYLLILILIVYSSCAVKVQEISLPDNIKINGKIKNLVSTAFHLKDSANCTVKKINSRIIAYYDRDGKLLYQLDYNYLKNSVSIDSTFFTYNNKKLVAKSVTSSNYDNNIMVQTYIYNNRSRQIEQICSVNNKLDFRIVKTYDKKGNVLTRAFYDSTNTLKNRDSISYNYKLGHYESFSPLSRQKSNYIIYFNRKGQLYLFKDYDKNSKLRSYSENYFDAYGNRIGNTNFNSDGKPKDIYKSVYVYDGKGNWLTKSGYHNGKLFDYNENTISYW